MSVQVSSMLKGFEANELEAIKQAHQTYYEVMRGCYLDGCCEPEEFAQLVKSFIDRHDEVQVMIQVMLDSIYYDDDELDYSIQMNDWILMKHDMILACVDQYEVWANLVDDEDNIEERHDMINRLYWLGRANKKLEQAF